ncbi:PF20097 family protein [Oscillibacter sp.]
MQCPFCRSEMEKGFIYGRKGCGLVWLPLEEKLPLIRAY